jgi:hypothetical protein
MRRTLIGHDRKPARLITETACDERGAADIRVRLTMSKAQI